MTLDTIQANYQKVEAKKAEYVIDIQDSEKGKIQIANGVIATIIQKNLLEIEGVTRLAPQGLMDGLANIFSKKGYDNNISIEATDDGAVISLVLNVLYGSDIPAVSAQIQEKLFAVIPQLTGYKVSKINIMVAALEDKIDEANDEMPPLQTALF